MGWRGPLPKPCVTPPPCLGEFLPASISVALEAAAGEVDVGGGPASGILAEMAGSGAFQISNDVQGGPVGSGDRGRQPWDHLRRRYRGIWRVFPNPNPLIPLAAATPASLGPRPPCRRLSPPCCRVLGLRPPQRGFSVLRAGGCFASGDGGAAASHGRPTSST